MSIKYMDYVRLLARSLANLSEDPESLNLTIDDQKKVMDIVEKLYKMGRLEEGKATEITELNTSNWTIKDIKSHARKSNPLFSTDYEEDGEFLEINEADRKLIRNKSDDDEE